MESLREAAGIEAKERCTESLQFIRCRINPVKIPADIDDQKCPQNPERMEATGRFFNAKFFSQPFPERRGEIRESDDDTVIQSPENVVQLRAVPDTDDEEYQNIGKAGRQHPPEVAAEMLLAPFAEVLHRLD